MTVAEALSLAVVWYLGLTAVTILAFPIVFHACRGLTDRGISLYRPLGLIIAVMPIWIIGNLASLPVNRLVFVGVVLLIGVLAWGFALRRGEIAPFLATRWRRIAVFEGVTAILFLGYALVRGYNPDAQATEKPMEIAFLNASIVTDGLPVTDPWFAGEPINYYYFGYFVAGLLSNLTSTPAGVAFTLGLATTFALATVAAAGVAVNLAERLSAPQRWVPPAAGIFAGFLLMFSGTLYSAWELLKAPSETLEQSWWQGIGWSASRVIEDTGFPDGGPRTVISEFPAFTWVLGDLHPHVLAYPWLIAAIGLIANLAFVMGCRQSLRTMTSAGALIGLVIAALYAANTWDIPVVALLALVALAFGVQTLGWTRSALVGAVIVTAAVIGLVPFSLHYAPPAGVAGAGENGVIPTWLPLGGWLSETIGFVTWDRSSLGELTLFHGGFLILLVVAIIGLRTRTNIIPSEPVLTWIVIPASVTALGLLLGAPAVIVFGLPLLALIHILVQRGLDTSITFAVVLVAIALTMILTVEFVFIRDVFGDRMNTVFKLYFQAWALLAIGLAVLVIDGLARLAASKASVQLATAIALVAIVILSGSVYTPISLYKWNDEFSSWSGLDGLHYIALIQPDEAAAASWLRQHAEPDDVILESPGCSYGNEHGLPHNRISMSTGLPTVIGWTGHERQWRLQQEHLLAEIPQRVDHVRQIYERPGDAEVAEYIERYGIQYIIVGVHERDGYADCTVGPPYDGVDTRGLEQLGWYPAMEAGDVVIYTYGQAPGTSGAN